MTFFEHCLTELLGEPQKKNPASGVADWDKCPRCSGSGFHSLPHKAAWKDRCKCRACGFLADVHDVLQIVQPAMTYGERLGWVDGQQRKFNSPRAIFERRRLDQEQRKALSISQRTTRNAAIDEQAGQWTKREMLEAIGRLNSELAETQADLNMANFALNPQPWEWPSDDELLGHVDQTIEDSKKQKTSKSCPSILLFYRVHRKASEKPGETKPTIKT